jgi:hypothetical protein
MTAPQLDLYDVAYLAGGPDRVVDTAVVALVRSGRVRVHTPGQLATADLSRRHPVEAAVLDVVGPKGHRSVDTIRWRSCTDERLLDVGRGLQRAGLLGRFGAVLPLKRGPRQKLAPTRAGRRVLEEYADRSLGDVEATRVALGGRSAMGDAKLRAAIFEPPDTTPLIPRMRRPSRRDLRNDPELAAQWAGAHGVAGGIYLGGAFDGGGGFDGGGLGGGGDGGGF